MQRGIAAADIAFRSGGCPNGKTEIAHAELAQPCLSNASEELKDSSGMAEADIAARRGASENSITATDHAKFVMC